MKKLEGNRKDWIKNILIIFLVVLLLLTFFSNTIMNYSLAEVSSTYITSGSISTAIRGTGTIQSVDPYNVTISEGRKVESVNVKKGDTVTITVNTTAPYKKTLSATFKVVSEGSPSYTIQDQSDGTVLLTILTNDYSGNITVKWQTGQLDPDSTNTDMADWSDASGQGILKAEDNTTYQLLFFKNITDSFTERSGMGTEINLTK